MIKSQNKLGLKLMIIVQEWNIHGASHQLLQAIDIIIIP